MATKEVGRPEFNDQMLLGSSKIFCQCSLNGLERQNYLQVSLSSKNCHFRRAVFVKESIFQNTARKLSEYHSHINLLNRGNPLK